MGKRVVLASIEFDIIKQFIKTGRYEFFFDKKNGDGEKTYRFMLEKGLTRSDLANVIVNLKANECVFRGDDNNPLHRDGIVYIFRSNQLDEDLYVKYKICSISHMLIFSVHRWNDV